MTITYDEVKLVQTLQTLPPVLRTAFAASVATRLLPAFSTLPTGQPVSADSTLSRILAELWNDLSRPSRSESELRSLLDECMSLMPTEPDDWAATRPYAEDAVSVVAYALRSRVTGSSQEAAWAARRAYETLDQYAINESGVSLQEPDKEERLVAHPKVQSELANQQQDLSELVLAQQSEDAAVIGRLRQRSSAFMYRFLAPSAS